MNHLMEKNSSSLMLQSENMYTQIIEYSVETIIIHVDCEILYINQSGVKFLKGSRETIIGSNLFSLFKDEMKSKMKNRIQMGMSREEPADLMEQTITRFGL